MEASESESSSVDGGTDSYSQSQDSRHKQSSHNGTARRATQSRPDKDSVESTDESTDFDPIIGIDLGTTNSAAAVLQGGTVDIIPNSEGSRTTPSVVAKDDGEWIVGEAAKNKRIQNQENTVTSIKRRMGDDIKCELEGQEYTPEQISSMILRKLRNDVSESLQTDASRAVITAPAYFSDRQRQATKDAAEIAGFDVERILNEPTAAAMAYGLTEDLRGDRRNILVYDLGGGTFDVSILTVTNQMFEVQATKGDTKLGGDDWDRELVDWAVNKFETEHGVSIRDDPQAMQRILDEAERVKMRLTSQPETDFTLLYLYSSSSETYDLEETISRTEFEEMTRHLVDQTTEPVQQALTDAGFTKDDIDDVILIGGATRMPMIRRRVNHLLDTEPRTDISPDEAVAIGAATQAGMIDDKIKDKALIDVTPLSLGVEVTGGLFERIIPRNTTIPTREEKTFTTTHDNQDHVNVRVFQGERDVAAENVLLDEFTLTGIPPAPAGEAEITVVFEIDENGIVSVSATEQATGHKADIRIEGGVGLPEETIEKMKSQARENHEQDKRFRQIKEAENELQARIKEARQILRQQQQAEHPDLPSNIYTNLEDLTEEAEDVLAHHGQVDNSLELLQKAHDRFDDILSRVWASYLDETAVDTETSQPSGSLPNSEDK